MQQFGLLVAQSLQYKLFFRRKKGVEKGLGDAYLFAQDINAAVNQSSVHDALEHSGQQSGPHLLPFLFGIGFSHHSFPFPFLSI